MKILLLRHAVAEDRAVFEQKGEIDRLRPLTDAGRQKMTKAVKGLKKVLPRTTTIVSSPYLRARQTADLLAESLSIPVVESDVLCPSCGVDRVMRWLESQQATRKGSRDKKGLIVLVGHEPQLSHLLGYLLTGSRRSIIKLKKGSATLVSCKLGQVRSGKMLWSLTAKQLRQVAKRRPPRTEPALQELAA